MKAQEAILAAHNASVAAWNRGDLSDHLAIYDSAVTSMSQDGPRHGIDVIEAAFAATYFNGGTSVPNLLVEQVAIRLLSESCAVMTGRYTLMDAANPSGWFSLIWNRVDGAWRVVHDHST